MSISASGDYTLKALWYNSDMAVTQYVALLRGINVGGKNIIKMADLKDCLSACGFANVATYIQSGNVLFEAHEIDQAKIGLKVNETLAKTFGYRTPVLLRSYRELSEIVARAPEGFGSELETYRYEVIFLRAPFSSAEAMESVVTREGVDVVTPGVGVLYFRRLISRASQSYISRLVAMPAYQSMSIRNWNTTTKLLALMEARG
jgi:uncharacterized protein (DUF1697 family)